MGHRKLIAAFILGAVLTGAAPVQAKAPSMLLPHSDAPAKPLDDRAGSTENTNPARSAPADDKGCRPIARLFGETICEAELKPEKDEDIMPSRPRVKPVRARELSTQAQARNMQRLKDLVWQKALVHKFGAAAIIPTDTEVASYRRLFDERMSSSYESDKKIIQIINDLLVQNEYLPQNKEKLTELLDMATQSVKLYEQKEQQKNNLPADYKFVTDTAQLTVARGMLAGWKSDKALYEAYGGKLYAGSGGYEPVDAYRAFLKYIRKEGGLQVMDPAYKEFLTPMDNYVVASHRDADPAPGTIDKYFSSPTWQFSLSNSTMHLDELKTRLESIPVMGLNPDAPVDQDKLIGKFSAPPSP